MEIFKKLPNVISTDGNYAHLMAVKFCSFWVPGTAPPGKGKWWEKLKNIGKGQMKDGPYEAFRISCNNIKIAWEAR